MEGVIALMIPILAITLGIGTAVWSMYLEHQRRRLQYQERQLMIERGMTPPPDLPLEKKSSLPPREDSLRRGIVMSFLGAGLGIGYWVLANSNGDGPPPWLAAVAAAVVGFIGLGNLAYYVITRRTDLPPER